MVMSMVGLRVRTSSLSSNIRAVIGCRGFLPFSLAFMARIGDSKCAASYFFLLEKRSAERDFLTLENYDF